MGSPQWKGVIYGCGRPPDNCLWSGVCKNGWTDRDVVWRTDSSMSKEAYITVAGRQQLYNGVASICLSVCLSHDDKKLCAQRNQWSVCHVADVARKKQQSRKVMQGNISVVGHCSHAANYSYMITAVKSVHGLATQTAATLRSDWRLTLACITGGSMSG